LVFPRATIGFVAPLPVLEPLGGRGAVAVCAEVHVADPPVVGDRARPCRAAFEFARYAPAPGSARRAVDAADAFRVPLGPAHADIDRAVDTAAIAAIVAARRAIEIGR